MSIYVDRVALRKKTLDRSCMMASDKTLFADTLTAGILKYRILFQTDFSSKNRSKQN